MFITYKGPHNIGQIGKQFEMGNLFPSPEDCRVEGLPLVS
jgi:hypothetical protein